MKKLLGSMLLTVAFAGQLYAQTEHNTQTKPETGEQVTMVDLEQHPEMVKEIVKNPGRWLAILKPTGTAGLSTPQARNKQVIRDILQAIISHHIVNDRSEVGTFTLTETSFSVNGQEQDHTLQQQLKAKYITSPDFMVYYGNSEKTGKGIFQRADNL